MDRHIYGWLVGWFNNPLYWEAAVPPYFGIKVWNLARRLPWCHRQFWSSLWKFTQIWPGYKPLKNCSSHMLSGNITVWQLLWRFYLYWPYSIPSQLQPLTKRCKHHPQIATEHPEAAKMEQDFPGNCCSQLLGVAPELKARRLSPLLSMSLLLVPHQWGNYIKNIH